MDNNPHCTGDYVTFSADGGKRRSRGAVIAGLIRDYKKEHGVRLELVSRSYDEMYGFLSRTSIRYWITRP